jgi:hypothetical protein
VRENLNHLSSCTLVLYVRVVSKPDGLQALPNRLGPQSTVLGQVPAVCQIGSCFESTKNSRHLPIAGAAAGFVGYGQRRVNGHQSRCASRDSLGDKVQNGVVVRQGRSTGQDFSGLGQNHPTRAIAW